VERDGVYGDDDALVAVPSVTAECSPSSQSPGRIGPIGFASSPPLPRR
jgi:hypothetical protein